MVLVHLRYEDEHRMRTQQRVNTLESIEPSSSINYNEHHLQQVYILIFGTTKLSPQNNPKRCVDANPQTFSQSLIPFALFSCQKNDDRTCISIAKHSYLTKQATSYCGWSSTSCIPLFLPSKDVSDECPHLEE